MEMVLTLKRIYQTLEKGLFISDTLAIHDFPTPRADEMVML